MRLEPLYRIRFTYPEGWAVDLGGRWEQHLYIAEGRCEGGITLRFTRFTEGAGDKLRAEVRAALDDGAQRADPRPAWKRRWPGP